MSAQESFFPQAHARSTDPETSHEAAAKVKGITQVQGRILACLSIQGKLTDEELSEVYHSYYPEHPVTDQSLRSRRSELVARGAVRFAGDYGYTRAGGRTRRWEVVR